MLIIKGDKNIVTVTRVYIASPEGANGRNVVAYGMLNALTSKYKTMVFRPAVSNHDEFTPILLAASNAGLGVALSTGLDVHKVREDKDTARGDIVGAFNDAMDVSRADAALIVGTDKSHVNDPTSYEFDANVAADLKAGVFLAVCTIDRWPHELDETVKLSIEGMEAAGNKVLGIFVTGCEPRHAFSVKETLAKYGLPVWTLPQVPFTDESTKDLALETFRKNAPTDEVLAALDVDVTAPITPYAFQFGLLGKAKSNKKTIVLPEGEEDRIIKAADYLLEREIVNLIIVGNKDAILARGKELGLNYLERARFQAMDDENVLKPMVAKLCELRAKKGMTEEQARKQLADASYFGTMLVVLGYADGLVSGSVNSTANTMWPCSPTAPSTSTRMPSSFPKSRCSPPRPHVPSASTRRSVCSPTPPSAPARDRTWTWSRKPPSCSRRRLRICRWSVPSSSTPPGPPPWPPPRPRATMWPDTSTCSSSRTCAPATSATKPCSAPPAPWPSARCCRVSTSR